jgi:DNA-binding Lrp family transcriptional regulator
MSQQNDQSLVAKRAQTQQIDSIDKELLNEIQWVFPLSNRPFYEIANQHNISEEEVMRRISRLSQIGLIRQINAIFDTRRLGYRSALIALEVREDRLDLVAQEINKHPGVSHYY